MGRKVLIIGESGTGKTFSMESMNPETTAIISPEKTELPFRKQFKMLAGKTDSKDIIKFMDDCVKEGKTSIIVDDFQYVLAIPYMHRIHESGWDKYNDFGGNYFDIIDHCKDLPDDVIVYFISHTETGEDGITRVKLIGKLLREKITIEGLFAIVFRSFVVDGKYYFATQNSGKDTVKTPFGMFDSYAIENNLNYVDEKIRSFFYMDGAKTDEEMKEADEAVKVDVEKPEAGRRSRKSRTEKAKEEVQKTMDKIDEIADGRSEVPFDEVMNDSPAEEKAEEQPVRRSRRRSEPAVVEQTEQPEEEQPKKRSRRNRGGNNE